MPSKLQRGEIHLSHCVPRRPGREEQFLGPEPEAALELGYCLL